MNYLRERKRGLSFITNSTARYRGKDRAIARDRTPKHHTRPPQLYWFALLVPVCAAAGFRSATRAQFAWSAISLGSLFLALMAVRNVPLCAVLCAAPVASFVEEMIGQLRPSLAPRATRQGLTSRHNRTIASCALALAGLSLSWVEQPHLAPDSSIATIAAAHLRPGRLFTTDSWADYLIFMDPSRQVFIDFRNDL
jgi:hypothetical protein